jgi:hypothetical protein
MKNYSVSFYDNRVGGRFIIAAYPASSRSNLVDEFKAQGKQVLFTRRTTKEASSANRRATALTPVNQHVYADSQTEGLIRMALRRRS